MNIPDERGEASLTGGSVTGASRLGETVRRSTGPWTPTVHALLRHLENAGFSGAPRVLGVDDQGREILSFIEGKAARYPWPAPLKTDEGVGALGALVRGFHDAARDFDPPEDAVYRIGQKRMGSGEIVCHGDLGPWNTIWNDRTVVGIIDWDFAEPAQPIRDVAQTAIYCVPLRTDETCRAAGFSDAPDRRSRLLHLCRGYGDFDPATVVAAALDMQRLEIQRLKTLGAGGVEPWRSFAERGGEVGVRADADWISAHRHELV